MDAAYLFFALDDPFGWIDKSEKFKKSIKKSYTRWRMKKDGRNKLWFNFDEPLKIKT